MKKTGQAGVATFVMRGKEYLVAIFSDNGILRAEVMRFPEELRSPKDVDLPEKPKVTAATVRKFEKLISTKSKKQFSAGKAKGRGNRAAAETGEEEKVPAEEHCRGGGRVQLLRRVRSLT